MPIIIIIAGYYHFLAYKEWGLGMRFFGKTRITEKL